jgi:hypothetical protein
MLLKTCFQALKATDRWGIFKWPPGEVTSLIKFNVKDNNYYILKYGKWYDIFNENGSLINQYSSVSNGLNEFISEMFDFKLKLPNRDGVQVIPPPAFLFLPFYIDQDRGWAENWSSFSKLRQFSNWRDPIVFYHTGLRPNEYYETKSSIENLNEKIKINDNEINILKQMLSKIKADLSNNHFDIDLDSFKEEIKQLLIETEKLNTLQNKLKAKLTDLYSQKISLEAQVKITQLALSENQKDYKYSLEELEDHVSCPTCGAEYENNFSERFAIAQDEQRCSELFLQLNKDLNDVNEKIVDTDKEFVSSLEEKQKIEEILHRRQGEVKLKDIIDSEGRKQIKTVFEQQQSDIKKITTNINEVGSTLPRALAAYYFSILHLINKYSSTVFCPIIIDEPNQQGQDDINLPRLLKFIKERQPENSQLILGLENTENVEFEGTVINVSSKNSLLLEEEYPEVYKTMKPFIDSCLYSKSESLF